MNIQEDVIYLAQVNSRSCHPLREDEVDKSLPYFEIYKNDIGRYSTNIFNYKNHDNAPRMDLWKSYLQNSIFPNIHPMVDICGFYNIQLHDSYTYLDDNKSYKNVLCFSKFKQDPDPILVPDPYMICNYGNMLDSVNDVYDWTQKLDKVCFCGTTTGKKNPSTNDRIKMCIWSLNHKDICDFYITKVAQMDFNNINNSVSEFNKIYRPPFSLDDQLKYKYHMVMDGNTCRFDVWYMKTNNVVMKYDSKEMLWYYPFLQSDTHYVEVNENTIRSKVNFFNNNHQHAAIMIYNTQRMAANLFRPIVHQMYTINLFENIAINK